MDIDFNISSNTLKKLSIHYINGCIIFNGNYRLLQCSVFDILVLISYLKSPDNFIKFFGLWHEFRAMYITKIFHIISWTAPILESSIYQ